MTDINLDTYGELNDIGPDEPAPREPKGEPDEITPKYKVWQFEADESDAVEDTYVVARNPHPLDFRMWVFVGRGDVARFVMRASHKYGENEVIPEGRDDCCEVLFDGQSLGAAHCPAEVEALVEELTDAAVATPSSSDETDHGGPINY